MVRKKYQKKMFTSLIFLYVLNAEPLLATQFNFFSPGKHLAAPVFATVVMYIPSSKFGTI